MTKTALNSSIESILVRNGIELSTQLAIDLLSLAAPKTPIRVQDNQPLVGTVPYNKDIHSIDDITSLYCLRFQKYFTVDKFNKSSKTSFGYSKESKNGVKLWIHFDKSIKALEAEISMEKDAVLDGVKTVEQAKEVIDSLNKEISNLKDLRGGVYTEEQFEEVFGISTDSTDTNIVEEQLQTEAPKEIVKKFPRKSKESK